jgi:hypothetical protein
MKKAAKSQKTPNTPITPRTLEQVNNEYTLTCSQAGETRFRMILLNKEIENLNGRLLNLDKHMYGLDEEAKIIKSFAEPKPPASN